MKKKVYVRAPVLSQSGYGEQSRFALRALRSRSDLFDIYIQPITWGQTGWVWEDTEFRRWMDEKIAKTQQLISDNQLKPDVSLQITIPNEFEKLCPINIGYTAGIETDRVSPIWLEKANLMNKVLVVSNHSKTVYENTQAQAKNERTGEVKPYKVTTPIDVVWETTPRHEPEEISELKLDYDFNFLIVSQLGPRKNFYNSITWFVEEFIDQEVGLVIKTNLRGNSIMDLEATEIKLNQILKNYPERKCKVYLLHGDLSSGQMSSLYTDPKIKAMINIAHGEGFGLPLFEAAREGLPIVTIPWSGQLDFLRHNGVDYFSKVKFSISPIGKESIWEGVIEANAMWAYAEQGSYKMTLRKVYKKWNEAKKTADKLKTIINEKFSDEAIYDKFISSMSYFIIDEQDEMAFFNRENS